MKKYHFFVNLNIINTNLIRKKIIFVNPLKLNERQQTILDKIVQLYILKGSPIGSRTLSKYLEETSKLSPATLRNIMSDLEEMDFISHPHTSAGRIPTDKGYRFYVDHLNNIQLISDEMIKNVENEISISGREAAFQKASKLLGLLSHSLSFIKLPGLADMLIKKIDIISLSSAKILVVLALESDIVKTLTIETYFEYKEKQLTQLARYINEKIAGKKLSFLQTSYHEIMQDSNINDLPLVRLFVESIEDIIESNKTKLITYGTQNLLESTQNEEIIKIKSVIELIEEEDIIIHILDKVPDNLSVVIGKEIGHNILEDYAFIKENYTVSSSSGTIGIIGPKRMNYPVLMALVKSFSEILSE